MDVVQGLSGDSEEQSLRGAVGKLSAEHLYARTQLRPRQDEWTRFHAAFRGQYLGVDFDADASKVYPKLTRMAVGMAMSKILPVLLPTSGDFWDIEPSEIPDLFEEMMKQQGVQGEIDPDQIADYALQANENMRRRIQDDIQEMRYADQMPDAVLDYCLFGTMVWRGPMASNRPKMSWVAETKPDGTFTLVKKQADDTKRPVYDYIPVRSFIPDPAVDRIEDANYAWVEHDMNAMQLSKLGSRPGFNKNAIRTLLIDNPNGNWVPETSDQDTATVNEEMSPEKRGRYLVLERWGWLGPDDLREFGLLKDEEDQTTHKMCQVWICGDQLLYAKTASYYEHPPFLVVPYEQMPGMLHGRGVAEQMEDPQSVMCSLVRALVDNIGFGVAPMGEVRVDKLAQKDSGFVTLSPRKLFATRRASEHNDDGKPAVSLFNVPVITNDIIQAMNFFMNLIQYQTSMPFGLGGMVSPGSSGVRTTGQQTMLFQQAENFVRVIITTLDKKFVTPFIRGIYDWEMAYSSDLSIKGDFAVVARGAQGAMEREVEAQKLMEVAQIVMGGGPELGKWLNIPAWMDALGRRIQLKDNIIFSPEEMAQIEQQQAALAAQQGYAQEDAKKFKAQTPYSDALVQLASSLDDSNISKPAAMAEAYRALGVASEPLYAALSIYAQKLVNQAQNEGTTEGQEAEVAGQDFVPPVNSEEKPDTQPSPEDQAQAQQPTEEMVGGGEVAPEGEGETLESIIQSAMASGGIKRLPPDEEDGGPGEQPQPERGSAAPVASTPAPSPAPEPVAVHVHMPTQPKRKRRLKRDQATGDVIVEDVNED